MQYEEMRLNAPSNDAASSPHQGNPPIVEGPAELFGCLSQEHEPLSIRNDLGGVEGLKGEK